jgi:hypothetical protein
MNEIKESFDQLNNNSAKLAFISKKDDKGNIHYELHGPNQNVTISVYFDNDEISVCFGKHFHDHLDTPDEALDMINDFIKGNSYVENCFKDGKWASSVLIEKGMSASEIANTRREGITKIQTDKWNP